MSTHLPARKPTATDVSDDEWALVAPYLLLLPEDALQRRSPLREVFNALRWIGRSGAPWRLLPTNFPPWPTVYQQTRRWLDAGCFEVLVHELRLLLRLEQGRAGQPSAAILDARVRQSSPERGARAGSDGHKRRKGSTVHAAVDTLGQLLAGLTSPANDDERTQVDALAAQIQAVTGDLLGPLENGTGDGVVRGQLGEDQTDEELTSKDNGPAPDECGATRAQAKGKESEDTGGD
jgi:transposase